MADDEKAELYKTLVDHADPWMVLERMRALGFWPDDEPVPEEPPDVQAERAELEDELERLRNKATKVADPKGALREERVRRWQESKKRRAAAKVEREAKQKARAEAWAARRPTLLVHAGDGLSGGLQGLNNDEARLQQLGLPTFDGPAGLAEAMGIPLATLRWLTFHRRSTTIVHYHRYTVPKKDGGDRHISAPKPALARAQSWAYDHILRRLDPEPDAHGFVPGRSVRSNALPHEGRAIVVNMDLEGFFPSIGFRRVKGFFAKLGYGEALATVFALLCTEPPRVSTELDGKIYHVTLGDRILPQGAATSPAITNGICRRLDRRLRGTSASLGFRYTRYADDLTFSGDHPDRLKQLMGRVRMVLTDEGFAENKKKTRIMRKGRRQEVTGLVVNDKTGLSRRQRRRLRAILHNTARNGLEAENRDDHRNVKAWLRGIVAWVISVDPDHAAQWRAGLERALEKS